MKSALLVLIALLTACAPTLPPRAVNTADITQGIDKARVANSAASSATVAARDNLALSGTALSRVDAKAIIILKWLKANP